MNILKSYVVGAVVFLLIAGLCATTPAATITASSCSQTDVQSAINSANTEDMIVVPPGKCAWSTPVSIPNTKGITLDGSGDTIAGSINLSLNSTIGLRITRFNFTGNNNVSAGGSKTSAPFRIDHCTFTSTVGGSTLLLVSGNAPGLIDHNNFTSPTNSEMIHNMALGPSDASGWSDDIVPGSADAVYLEDNTFTNNGLSGNPAYFWGNSSTQSYYGARTVFRHNTLNMSQIDQHGTPGMIGARWWEVYENTFNTGFPNASQCCFITVRAGSGVIFNNHHTGANQVTGSIDLYEEDTGYPALYQIGRGKNQVSDPAYVWGNDASMSVGSQTPTMVQVSRDYFLTAKPGYTPYTYPHPLISGTSKINVIGHLQERQTPFSILTGHFNSSVLLTFHNPHMNARINVFSADGRKVMTLANIQSDKVELNAKDLAQGIYALELQADGKVFRQHICIVK